MTNELIEEVLLNKPSSRQKEDLSEPNAGVSEEGEIYNLDKQKALYSMTDNLV